MGADLNYRLARLNDGQLRRLVLAVGLNSSFLHKNQASKIKKPSKEIITVRLSGVGFKTKAGTRLSINPISQQFNFVNH